MIYDVYNDKLVEIAKMNTKKVQAFLKELKPRLKQLKKDMTARGLVSSETGVDAPFEIAPAYQTRLAFPYEDGYITLVAENYENYLRVTLRLEVGQDIYKQLFVVIYSSERDDVSCVWCDDYVACHLGLTVMGIDNCNLLTITNTSDLEATYRELRQNLLDLYLIAQ